MTTKHEPGTAGYTRDLSVYVDRFGNISVQVAIGHDDPRATGANNTPAMVARFLRELADDVERAG